MKNMEKTQTQTEPKKASTQFDNCPYCGKEIVVGWPHISVVSLKEYQEEVKHSLQSMKEKRKA
jgi:transcription elongation factor Elf1